MIIWEEAFFCFLCHEHMEVNLDLSLWLKRRARGPRELKAKTGLSLAPGLARRAAADQRPGKL